MQHSVTHLSNFIPRHYIIHYTLHNTLHNILLVINCNISKSAYICNLRLRGFPNVR